MGTRKSNLAEAEHDEGASRLAGESLIHGPAASRGGPVDSLVLDLLAWMGPEPRPYAEVLEAWRTSCPRLPVWETANARGFITRGRGAVVSVSPAGMEYLRAHRAAAGR
jgi:hypothetical protein